MTDKSIVLDKYGGTFPERFWSKVDTQAENGWESSPCWVWSGATAGSGYGVIQVSDYSIPKPQRQAYTHRCSWEMHNGPIPDGLYVLHHCDNPACVNPNHLFLGTQQDNVTDMVRKGRQRTVPLKGSKNGRAKLTRDDVKEIRRRHAAGESQIQIAKDYPVNQSHIWRIVARESWRHIS